MLKKVPIILAIVLSMTMTVYAKDIPVIRMKSTAYCLDGLTKTETQTRYGICAGKEEWLGKTIVVYENDNNKIGDYIGHFKCEDTGPNGIKAGKVLDVWLPNEQMCKDYGTKDIIAVILE